MDIRKVGSVELEASLEDVGQRLNLAFDLFEFGTEMMRQKLRRENPDAGEEELETRYLAWLQERPGAELGDAAGRPRSWPPRES